mgnify:FL=1
MGSDLERLTSPLRPAFQDSRVDPHSTHSNSWGKLYERLQDGWHRVEIDVSDIENPGEVKDIGVQIKNWSLDGEVTFYIDEVMALEPQ